MQLVSRGTRSALNYWGLYWGTNLAMRSGWRRAAIENDIQTEIQHAEACGRCLPQSGEQQSDDAVCTWIKEQLAADPKATQLLWHYRQTGSACEVHPKAETHIFSGRVSVQPLEFVRGTVAER